MSAMSEESQLRDKALQCRRLAKASLDERTRRVLFDLAIEYDGKAKLAHAGRS
jgi:hypothetical protein